MKTFRIQSSGAQRPRQERKASNGNRGHDLGKSPRENMLSEKKPGLGGNFEKS